MLDEQKLYQKALHYVGHYGSSSGRVTQILQKYCQKYSDNADEYQQISALIPDILARLAEDNFIDDQRFIEARFHSRLGKGDSLIMLRQKLHQQGISVKDMNQSLPILQETYPDAEYQALETYAKKRKLLHGIVADTPVDYQHKQYITQKLLQHGFPYQLIQAFMTEHDI